MEFRIRRALSFRMVVRAIEMIKQLRPDIDPLEGLRVSRTWRLKMSRT